MPLRLAERHLIVTPGLAIPLSEFDETYIRASGPGGQHVNKTSTAVQLRFNVTASQAIDDATRQRLMVIAGNRLTGAGELVITAGRFRSREQNRRDAFERVARLLERASHAPRKRKRTKPTRAARERRLQDKRRRGNVKRLRGRPDGRD